MSPSTNTPQTPPSSRPQKRLKVAEQTEEHTRNVSEERRIAQRKEPPRTIEYTQHEPLSPTLPTYPTTPSPEPPLRQPAPLPSRANPTIYEMQSPLHLYDAADFKGLPTAQAENPHTRMSRQGPAPGTLQKNCLVFTSGAMPLAHVPVYKFFGNTSPDQESGVRQNSASVLAAVIHGGGQRFVTRSPEKAAEIKTFLQSLRFLPPMQPSTPASHSTLGKGKAPETQGPIQEDESMRDGVSEEGEISSRFKDLDATSTPARNADEPQPPPSVMVYAPEMKHAGEKNRFGQPWTYFIELGPGESLLREYLLWQSVFAVHPTLSFSVYPIAADEQPWTIMVLSGPTGAVEDTTAAKHAVLTTIKEKLWADRDFLWFTARQVAANWEAAGTLAELVKMATDTLDASVVMADDPSSGRSAPAYLISGKPVSNTRVEYKRWVGFFTNAKTYRRGLHCLAVNKLVVDCFPIPVHPSSTPLLQHPDGTDFDLGASATQLGEVSFLAAEQPLDDEQGQGSSGYEPPQRVEGHRPDEPSLFASSAQPERQRSEPQIEPHAVVPQPLSTDGVGAAGVSPADSTGSDRPCNAPSMMVQPASAADVTAQPAPEPNRVPRHRAEKIGQKTTAIVATLNINGFGTMLPDHPDNKWGRIYSMMREERIAILLVQETHLTDRRVADLHEMYAGSVKILHSPHPDAPTQKEGVAVVLNAKLINTSNAKMKVIVPGCAIQVSVAWRGGDVRHLLCVYAPTSEGVNERRAFFRQVLEYYTVHTSLPRPHLMAGDFNNVEDPIDRLPISPAHDPSIEDLDELKSALNLMIVDGWRATHPSARNYTFHRGSGEAATMSRLDRIYVNDDIFQFARQWDIKQPSIKTDHLLAMVQLSTPNDPEVGPGRTVFPLHLLTNKDLTKRMKSRGLKAWDELQDLERSGSRTDTHNPQTVLTALKKDWLAMARALEKATVPKLMSDINALESLLKHLRDDRHVDDCEKAAEINALTAQIRGLQAKWQKQRQGNSRAKHRLEEKAD
ncbi:hypothetical protein BN946_scf185034.g9 [Trametes cinnabarina]|uniref:Endonuclease/exonuclease/phosphatase domain-containing protein n=1 Tax=Pycnoporus cinnabarinus TaxID=5643 RepID=A0A060SPS5_PYCCI|nr:hypothetical protein BN946_scf185034.g9 [Trametes cinnabarina]